MLPPMTLKRKSSRASREDVDDDPCYEMVGGANGVDDEPKYERLKGYDPSPLFLTTAHMELWGFPI